MRRTRNAVYGQPYRGFESHPLRQLFVLCTDQIPSGRKAAWFRLCVRKSLLWRANLPQHFVLSGGFLQSPFRQYGVTEVLYCRAGRFGEFSVIFASDHTALVIGPCLAFVECETHHATWNPAREPTSLLLKP